MDKSRSYPEYDFSTIRMDGEFYYIDLDVDCYFKISSAYEDEWERGCYTEAVKNYFDDVTAIPENSKSLVDLLSVRCLKKNLFNRDMMKYICRKKDDEGKEGWKIVSLVVCQRSNKEVHSLTMQIIGISDIVQSGGLEKIKLEETLRQTRKADRAKTNFLSSMSHDMRTPLNVIVGMCMLADINEDDHEKVHDCLQKITTSSRILLNLVNEVLDMAKIESGRLDLTEKEFSIADMMRDIIMMTNAMLVSKDQRLLFDMSGIIHQSVAGDETRIKQILLNIISNSVKYSKEKSTITIDIRESPGTTENINFYIIDITDEGKGMSREFAERLFEPFVRNENDYGIEGTGLGMTIAKNIAEAMKGKIVVESEPDKGTHFEVVLPLRISGSADLALGECALSYVDYKEQGMGEIRDKIHVLMAEDNVMNAQVGAELLKCIGVEATIASDGIEVCRLFKESQIGEYDCIFMDIQMPECGGIEAAQNIRHMERKDSDIPIFAMTANAFTGDVERTREAGMQEHIIKPFELQDIYNILKKWFPKSEI